MSYPSFQPPNAFGQVLPMAAPGAQQTPGSSALRPAIIVGICLVVLFVVYLLYPGLAAQAVRNAQPSATPQAGLIPSALIVRGR